MKIWEQQYLLVSPVSGKVSFTKIWSINQNVSAGDNVISVVPTDSKGLIGKLQLAIEGSGKVKKGQRVNIKLVNYPHMEYGMLLGIIERVSLVPAEIFYCVEISLPNGLMTNYGEYLRFSQQMKASAEIITEDVRLIEKFFNPIKSVFMKNKRR